MKGKTLMRILALGVIFTLLPFTALSQQQGTPVTETQYPTDQPTRRIGYDGSNNVIYIGYAVAKQPAYSVSVTGSTLTSIVVATNTATITFVAAHGLAVNNPLVISGSTTSALNGTYKIATVGSTTTATFTTSGVADATYNNAALTATTTAARTTAAIWSIACYVVTSSNTTALQWVNGLPKIYNQIWDNRATLTCQ